MHHGRHNNPPGLCGLWIWVAISLFHFGKRHQLLGRVGGLAAFTTFPRAGNFYDSTTFRFFLDRSSRSSPSATAFLALNDFEGRELFFLQLSLKAPNRSSAPYASSRNDSRSGNHGWYAMNLRLLHGTMSPSDESPQTKKKNPHGLLERRCPQRSAGPGRGGPRAHFNRFVHRIISNRGKGKSAPTKEKKPFHTQDGFSSVLRLCSAGAERLSTLAGLGRFGMMFPPPGADQPAPGF